MAEIVAANADSVAAQEQKAAEAGEALTLSPIHTRRYSWAEVETAIGRIRDARTTSPQVQSSLNEWYNLIADPSFSESQEVPEHCVKLAVWAKARSDSPIPLIAQAKALLNYAWHVRENGLASNAPASGQEAFRSHVAEARQMLEQAIKLGVKDGEAHALLVDIARAEGRSLAEARARFDAGCAVDPTYVWLYSAMAEYLLPRWYGKLGDVEKFAEEVVRTLPGDDGLDAYGHIAYVVNQYDGNVLFWGSYDRELLVKAAEVMVRRYPTATNVVPFAALCTVAAQDHVAARKIRPHVTSSDAPRVRMWKVVAADYFRWCSADEVASGQCTWLWGTPLNYGNVAFADSGSLWCPSGYGRAAVTLMDIEKRSVSQVLSGAGSRIFEVAFDPDKKWLVGAVSGESFQGWVRWNPAGEGTPLSHRTAESCQAIAINAKRDQIAWAESKAVRTMNLTSGEAGPQIDFDKTVERLKFSADGKWLAVSAGSISVWDATTGKKRYALPAFESQPRGKIACEQLLDFDEEGRVWATAFVIGVKPVQRPLIRCSVNGKAWDTIIPHLNGLGSSAVISTDHRLLAIAENNNEPGGPEAIQIWDVPGKRMQTRLPGHHNHIASLAFSPDGKRLASVGYLGGVVKVWSLDGKAKSGNTPKKGPPL